MAKFPLKKGSSGAEVKALQEYLIQKYKVEFPQPQGANGNFGPTTESFVKEHLKVNEVSEAMFHNLIKSNALGKVLTPEEMTARKERTALFAQKGLDLFGAIINYKTARETRKATEAQAAMGPPPPAYYPTEMPIEPQKGKMPKALVVGIILLILGIAIAIVFALKKKNVPTES